MTFGGIKKYYIVHLDFTTHEYRIYEYEKDRRLTANQAWVLIRSNQRPIDKGQLEKRDTIERYWVIIKERNYSSKHCDRYISF
jgi:hypothetical protein